MSGGAKVARPLTAMRIKLRTKDSSMEYAGSISEGIVMSFYYLPAGKRAKVIEELQAVHAKLVSQEPPMEDVK